MVGRISLLGSVYAPRRRWLRGGLGSVVVLEYAGLRAVYLLLAYSTERASIVLYYYPGAIR